MNEPITMTVVDPGNEYTDEGETLVEYYEDLGAFVLTDLDDDECITLTDEGARRLVGVLTVLLGDDEDEDWDLDVMTDEEIDLILGYHLPDAE